MIVTAGYVVVIAAVLALIWTMQRRFIYFPTSGVPTPTEIGLTDVEPVTFETIDGLSLSGWFFAASGPSPRVTVLVFHGNAGSAVPSRQRSNGTDSKFYSSIIGAMAEIPEPRPRTA